MGFIRVFFLRLAIWFMVKFIYPKDSAAWCVVVRPLFRDKWPPILLTLAVATDDVVPTVKACIDDFEKNVVAARATPAPVIPFKRLEGGKMPTKLTNLAPFPLVSVILVSYSGDIHLLDRAVQSVLHQDMDLGQIELFIYFDGKPTAEELKTIEEINSHPFIEALYNAQLIFSEEKNGYYCVGRNRVTPLCQGFYLYNMDADNEIAANHLSGLLKAIREPDGENGFPNFVYSRRRYIVDKGTKGAPTKDGLESTLTKWDKKSLARLVKGPKGNFIDTGDVLFSKGMLYRLADITGCIWNSQCRRFGDWDIMMRLAACGARGKAVNQVTNLYHWTGSNLQMTRNISDIMAIPESVYNKMVAEGKIKTEVSHE